MKMALALFVTTLINILFGIAAFVLIVQFFLRSFWITPDFHAIFLLAYAIEAFVSVLIFRKTGSIKEPYAQILCILVGFAVTYASFFFTAAVAFGMSMRDF